MVYNNIQQDLDHVSAYFQALQIFNDRTNIGVGPIENFENTIIIHEEKLLTKTIILKAIEGIKEIRGTLNIDNIKNFEVYNVILDKWAKVLQTSYSLTEKQDCLTDICSNFIEDHEEYPIVIHIAISITTLIMGFIQQKLKEE